MTTTAGPTSEIPQIPLPVARTADVAGVMPLAGPPKSSGAVAEGTPAESGKSARRTKAGKAPKVKAAKGKPAEGTGAPESAPRAGKAGKGRTSSAGRSSTVVVVGGVPRVDLLPPSIRVLDRQKRSRRTMRVAAVGVAIIVLAGTGASWYLDMEAQSALLEAQNESASLLQQQNQYSDLVNTERQISLTTAAQAVGGSTDVDWRGYLTKLQATLPAGVVITTVLIDSAAPGIAYEQSSTPLEGARVATLSFTAISPSLPDVPTWLDGLRSLDAFVDATPNSVQLDATDGTYRVDITMHVSSEVYSGRYATNGTDAQ